MFEHLWCQVGGGWAAWTVYPVGAVAIKACIPRRNFSTQLTVPLLPMNNMIPTAALGGRVRIIQMIKINCLSGNGNGRSFLFSAIAADDRRFQRFCAWDHLRNLGSFLRFLNVYNVNSENMKYRFYIRINVFFI